MHSKISVCIDNVIASKHFAGKNAFVMDIQKMIPGSFSIGKFIFTN